MWQGSLEQGGLGSAWPSLVQRSRAPVARTRLVTIPAGASAAWRCYRCPGRPAFCETDAVWSGSLGSLVAGGWPLLGHSLSLRATQFFQRLDGGRQYLPYLHHSVIAGVTGCLEIKERWAASRITGKPSQCEPHRLQRL